DVEIVPLEHGAERRGEDDELVFPIERRRGDGRIERGVLGNHRGEAPSQKAAAERASLARGSGARTVRRKVERVVPNALSGCPHSSSQRVEDNALHLEPARSTDSHSDEAAWGQVAP